MVKKRKNKINEIVYKALFLSLSVLVIKEGIERPGNQETMVR